MFLVIDGPLPPPARHRSVRPERRDGHVLYPCGCGWNVRLKGYSITCLTGPDDRTATPPHKETQCPFPKDKPAVQSHRPPKADTGEGIGTVIAQMLHLHRCVEKLRHPWS